ncbi:flagellin FliC [Cobetia sp. UIB-001]|uniref:flagellin N-terminal helical domain-containing protein n=1 Tax=Cobetia sp. UIB-001 TaxID=2717697 RepID=UPI00384E6964
MASVINTNTLSMVTQQNLNQSQNALNTSMERLSSGLRINSAKDDAAGQAIANRMDSQITGLSQAQRNANDGISVAQTAEGALNQVNDNLQRVRELTVQAQNGTNNADDLSSIQDEITMRLDEINRISEQTSFNGINVLQEDSSMSIQVGANDGQTINIDLKNITSQTLGLDGFNVDGSGIVQNKSATINDLTAAGAVGTDPYVVTTNHEAATFEQAFSQMSDGNTVTTGATATRTTYTFDSSENNFKYDKTVDGSASAEIDDLLKDQNILPTTGTKTGTYTNSAGDTANFEVDATGAISLGGETAYWTDDGNLTSNNSSGSLQNATMSNMVAVTGGAVSAGVTAVADSSARSFTIDNNVYTGSTTANELSYKETATIEDVENAVGVSTDDAVMEIGAGVTTADVTFDASSTDSNDTYIDSEGELTDIATYSTDYEVDEQTGAVTVAGNGTNVEGTKYAKEVGASVYLGSEGKLTTSETSQGDRTQDPLAALDSALKEVDSMRSDLGAVQNRFDSAITNLATTETNLASAQSRIQDADYAEEVSSMTTAQILQQAGTSMLTQANQVPQNVLSLLG